MGRKEVFSVMKKLRTRTLRPIDNIRNLRQAIEWRDAPPSRTEVLEDEPHKQALDQLLPQIAAESEQASKPVRQSFYYYRRKRSGRRCSCFQVETSPDANCQICYSAGFVGGWDMNGCRSEWLDVTYPGLRMVNVIANFKLATRPVYFTLEDDCYQGFIEADIPLVRNIRLTQAIQLGVGGKNAHNQVNAFIKAPNDVSFVPLDQDSLAARLNQSTVTVRIEISRQNLTIPSPKFSHLMLRYKLIPEIFMYADMNLAEDAFEMGDFGFFDAFATLSLYIPPSFDHIGNEDFLIRLSDNRRFKITRLERNAVSQILLSTKAMARLLIPGTDALLYYP